jgi:hypothetical protein
VIRQLLYQMNNGCRLLCHIQGQQQQRVLWFLGLVIPSFVTRHSQSGSQCQETTRSQTPGVSALLATIQTAAGLQQMLLLLLMQLQLLPWVQQVLQQMLLQHAQASSVLQQQQARPWQQQRQVAELQLVAAGHLRQRPASSC